MTKTVERNVPVTKLSGGKNYCLNFFQALACCLIVFLHARFPGYNVPVQFGFIMRAIARFGVPLFFIISGFFLFKENLTKEETRAKLKKRILHIGGLALFSLTLYFIIYICINSFGKNAIGAGAYLKRVFTWQTIVQFIFLNNSFHFFPHCWFLLAMLTSYLIIYAFPNLFIKNKWFVYVLSSLLAVVVIFRLIVAKYDPVWFGVRPHTDFFYRSWYANALLFMSLGIVLKRNIKKLVEIPKQATLAILIASFPLMVLERWFAKAVCNADPSYLFTDILCSVNMIVFAMQHPTLFSNFKLLNLEGSWTTYVYIFHPALIKLVKWFMKAVKAPQKLIDWLYPVVVLILAVALAILFSLLISKLFAFIKTQKQKKLTEEKQ